MESKIINIRIKGDIYKYIYDIKLEHNMKNLEEALDFIIRKIMKGGEKK